MKICTNGLGHMTMRAPCQHMVNRFKNVFSRTRRPIAMKLGMQHSECRPIIIYSNCDPSLTLRYFMPRSSMVTYVFVWKKVKIIFRKLLQPMLVATLH